MFEETNRLRVFLQKKIEQLEVIYNRESNNKRRKKETMKTSRQTQCGKPDKRKGTSPSHPYSPSKNTSRSHAATGASSPPRTTLSQTKYDKRSAGPKLFPYRFRSPLPGLPRFPYSISSKNISHVQV